MNYSIYNLATGLIDKVVNCPEESIGIQFDPELQGYIEGNYDDTAWRIVDGVAVAGDTRTLDEYKFLAKSQLELGRAARAAAPISFEGATLDADLKSQGNIKDKLADIDQRRKQGMDFPAELLFWRDFDNLMHTFVTVDEYEAWLSRLLIAIAERGTRTYVWMWGQKAQIDASTTLNELQAVEVV